MVYNNVDKVVNINYNVFGNTVDFMNFIEQIKGFVDKERFVRNLLGISKSNLFGADKVQSYKSILNHPAACKLSKKFLAQIILQLF